MNIGSLGVLDLLGRPADPQDVVSVFQLVLGRRPGRATDVDFHVNAPIAKVVAHIMGSSEFLDRVLPQIAGNGDAALLPVSAELAHWARATFGPDVDAYAETRQELLFSCFRSAAFAEILRQRPKLKERLRAELPEIHAEMPAAPAAHPVEATAPAAGPAILASVTPAAPITAAPTAVPMVTPAPPAATSAPLAPLAPRLLCLAEARPLADEPVLAARRMVLSAEFEAAVLRPLTLGKPPTALPDPAAAGLAALLFQGRLNPGPLLGKEAAARSLLRLLRHADSLLRPDPDAWSREDLPRAAVERLAVLSQDALASQAKFDPLLRAPMFLASAGMAGVEALFRYVMGRLPTARDRLPDMQQQGYPATLLRMLLTPEFERFVLRPLRAGRPVRHVAEAGLDKDHLASLMRILGRKDAAPTDWPTDLARTLGDTALLEALEAAETEADPAGLKAYVLAALRRLGEEARLPPRAAVTVELRDDRKLVFLCRGLPPGQRLVVDIAITGPQRLSRRVEASRNADGQFEAIATLPVLSFEPHGWLGQASFGLRDDVARQDLGPPAAPMPLRLALDAPVLQKLRARLAEETKRALNLADNGRRREALSLLNRLMEEAPGFHEARLLAASLTAAAGDAEGAETLLRDVTEAGLLPAAAELRARLALHAGRIEQAAEAFAMVEPAAGLHGRAVALLAAACAPMEPSMAADPDAVRLREMALRLLREPGQTALPLAITMSLSPGMADRAAFGTDVAAALALAFVPAASLGEFLLELDARDILQLDPISQDAEFRSLRHLMLPALAHLPPTRFQEARLVLAIGRVLDAQGRNEEALRFVEQAVHLDPDDFETRSVAAILCQRLHRADDAARHMEHALALKPDDMRATERLLGSEIEARKRDPLRPPQRHERLQGRLLELMQKALLKAPKSPTARLDYARFALMTERHEEAEAILRGLATEDPAWAAPRSMLMRLCQQRNDHAGVLAWFESLHPEQVDERAVIAAVKARRALGAVTEAQDLLAAHLDGAGPALRREYVRNLFFKASFEEAAAEATRLLAQDANDLELHFLAAAANLELQRNEQALFHAAWVQMHGGSQLYPLEMPLFLYAALQRNGDQAGALQQLDVMFARIGAQTVRLDPRLAGKAFDQLSATGLYPADSPNTASLPNTPVFEGPKVSVVMTTFNVKDYVRTAVRSILQQTYRNLELIIVDDASTDSTPAILAELERSDPRIKLILKSTNDGTYVSKNLGLMQAQGEFAAFQDSDDWSHPDRLACSIGVLLRHPGLIGLTTDWLRMTTEGEVVIKAGGQIAHLCCISLVFRRLPVLTRIGFFDSVRIAADLELIQRLGLVFGTQNVPRLRWPLLFGRTRSDSLTASEEFGISRIGFTEPREMYHRYADAFHAQIAKGGSAYMPFPLRHRLFEAPAIILPKKNPA
jgi:tetratricopeptide (TPR) repeat protein